ncbi:uncharacterized protein LOC119585246 [Penaeus monodon]|uniref:uncharacterized protein LOC119585246 n=1 Tax=Penaeus monodon TaxID=6687 RepID=UPI0018A70B18|nr:uncharacterized protein LOC119585246 [Penaeus monodon]
MALTTVNIATLYSSAQCVLSVVGSVGVILLFAGIPQLIYSDVISVANLLTFILGAVLITTMVAGNSFLNYKYRRITRAAQESGRDSSEAGTSQADTEDKPPSYDAILDSDGLPPNYYSVVSEKPPRYEDIIGGRCTEASSETQPQCEQSPAATVPPPLEIIQTPAEVNVVLQEGQPKSIVLDHRETSSSAAAPKDVVSKLGCENPSFDRHETDFAEATCTRLNESES